MRSRSKALEQEKKEPFTRTYLGGKVDIGTFGMKQFRNVFIPVMGCNMERSEPAFRSHVRIVVVLKVEVTRWQKKKSRSQKMANVYNFSTH